jgi:hypothetical protein
MLNLPPFACTARAAIGHTMRTSRLRHHSTSHLTPPWRDGSLPPRAAYTLKPTATLLAMADLIPTDEQWNYETFRDCLSEPVLRALAAPIEKAKPRTKRYAKKGSKERDGATVKSKKVHANGIHTGGVTASDTEELGDFIEVSQPPYITASLTISSTSAASSSPAYPSNYARSRTSNTKTPSPCKTPTPHPSPHQLTPTSSKHSPQTPSTVSKATASSHPSPT